MWNHEPSHVGLPTELQDIRLLLDQRSEAEDLAIPEVIHEKFFVNPNIWHVKVSLVVYATIEMHETDRRLNENWPVFYSQHINMWNNRYDFLPTHEPIIVPELTCYLKYMP
ncbi:hypothetical protein Gotur_008998 [Gossypium turneri]